MSKATQKRLLIDKIKRLRDAGEDADIIQPFLDALENADEVEFCELDGQPNPDLEEWDV